LFVWRSETGVPKEHIASYGILFHLLFTLKMKSYVPQRRAVTERRGAPTQKTVVYSHPCGNLRSSTIVILYAQNMSVTQNTKTKTPCASKVTVSSSCSPRRSPEFCFDQSSAGTTNSFLYWSFLLHNWAHFEWHLVELTPCYVCFGNLYI
jgi:hypothetical protein